MDSDRANFGTLGSLLQNGMTFAPFPSVELNPIQVAACQAASLDLMTKRTVGRSESNRRRLSSLSREIAACRADDQPRIRYRRIDADCRDEVERNANAPHDRMRRRKIECIVGI